MKVGPTILRVLNMWQFGKEVGSSLLACWWVWGIYLAGLWVLTRSGQGADAVTAAVDSQGAPAFWLFAATVLAAVQGQVICGELLKRRAEKNDENTTAPGSTAFAAHFVPLLIPILLLLVWPQMMARSFPGDLRGGAWLLMKALFGMSVGISTAVIYGQSTAAGAQNEELVTGILMASVIPAVLLLFLPGPAWLVGTLTVVLTIVGVVFVIQWLLRSGHMPLPKWRFWAYSFGGIYGIAALWVLVKGPSAVGAAAVVMLILQTYVVFLWFLKALVKGFFAPLVLLLCGLVWFGRVQDRPVRPLPEASRPAGAFDTYAQTYAHDWLDARRAQIAQGEYPVFIVAAEGGGIRAGYWTASVLGALSDAAPGFRDHIVALSGVSGGSLGVATYASLAAEPEKPSYCSTNESCAQLILSGDFLAPALATMFTSDVLNSILRQHAPLDDRAVALEKSFEKRWKQVMGNDRFSHRLGDPALFLNATSDMSGKKVSIESEFFPLPLRLSTAVLLSARFPVISPGGLVNGDRLVDGGFYDNSGTATASQLLAALSKEADKMKLKDHLKPVAILIANDETAPDDVCKAEPEAPAESMPLLGAVLTLDRVRAAHARRFRDEFERQVKAWPGGEVLDVGLYHCQGQRAIPLGWTLSKYSQDTIASRLKELKQRKTGGFLRAVELSKN